MSSRAPIGHLGIAAIPLCTNQGCKSFVPRAVETKFLYYALWYALNDIRSLGSGAVFPEVSKKKLADFEIHYPPLDQQSRIAEELDRQLSAVNSLRDAAIAQVESIYALEESVVNQAFRP